MADPRARVRDREDAENELAVVAEVVGLVSVVGLVKVVFNTLYMLVMSDSPLEVA
jgi:hypothetical protein